MSGTPSLKFEIFVGGELVRTAIVSESIVKIGKLTSSHLRLDDPNVSKIHAVIEQGRGGTYSIVDLGSKTGTMVNGEKINKCELNAGDKILVGDTTIVMHLESTGPVAVAPASGPVRGPDEATVEAGSPAVGGDEGHYDEDGNWHDGQGGYYDPDGNYFDAEGGYYDPAGNYFHPDGGVYDPDGKFYSDEEWEAVANHVPTDSEVFEEMYLASDHSSNPGGLLEVALIWKEQLLQVKQFKESETVTLGDGDKFTFPLEPQGFESGFALVSGQVVNFAPGMKGTVHVGDQKYTLEEAAAQGLAQPGGYGPGSYAVKMTNQTRVRVDTGEITFLVHIVPPAGAVPVGLIALLALGGAGGQGVIALALCIFASAFVQIGFLLLALFMPPKTDEFQLQAFDLDNRFVSQVIKPEEEQKEEEKPEFLKNNQPEEGGAKAKGSEGKAGKEESKNKNTKMAIKGPKDATELQIAKDREVVMNTGALAVLGSSQISASWGSGSVSTGFDAVTSMGDNQGSAFGTAYGFGAFGTTGFGRGGGGTSDRSFGAGGFGTAGRGGGGGGGRGYGKAAGQLAEKSTVVPKFVPGRPQVTGSLDKELIRRVIRKHRREIKYCYEQQLIKQKNLAGKVIVQYTISSTGSVVAAVAKSSTLGNKGVERCLTSKIRRWIFPEPKGGGIVIVKYPFVFSAG